MRVIPLSIPRITGMQTRRRLWSALHRLSGRRLRRHRGSARICSCTSSRSHLRRRHTLSLLLGEILVCLLLLRVLLLLLRVALLSMIRGPLLAVVLLWLWLLR